MVTVVRPPFLLKHIATMFSNGEFSIPMFVHDQVPPGVPVMKEKRAEISYSFEELPAGGRVRIKTKQPDALKAIHEFLRFQIDDHHTGDTTDIGSLSPPAATTCRLVTPKWFSILDFNMRGNFSSLVGISHLKEARA